MRFQPLCSWWGVGGGRDVLEWLTTAGRGGLAFPWTPPSPGPIDTEALCQIPPWTQIS